MLNLIVFNFKGARKKLEEHFDKTVKTSQLHTKKIKKFEVTNN